MKNLIKIAIVGCFATMMSGCVYRVVEPQENYTPPSAEQKKDIPTSYSYPLPQAPKQINNYISNQPLPANSDGVMKIEKAPDQPQSPDQSDQDSVSVVSPESDQGNIDNSNNDQQNAPQKTQSDLPPVGSFDNPISYKQ